MDPTNFSRGWPLQSFSRLSALQFLHSFHQDNCIHLNHLKTFIKSPISVVSCNTRLQLQYCFGIAQSSTTPIHICTTAMQLTQLFVAAFSGISCALVPASGTGTATAGSADMTCTPYFPAWPRSLAVHGLPVREGIHHHQAASAPSNGCRRWYHDLRRVLWLYRLPFVHHLRKERLRQRPKHVYSPKACDRPRGKLCRDFRLLFHVFCSHEAGA